MRTIADAFDEFFHKTGKGIKDLINSKMDSDATIAYATRAGSADTATNATNATNANHATNADQATNAGNAAHADTADIATKATQDSAGNIIVNTYAKISDIPSGTVDAYTKAESDARYFHTQTDAIALYNFALIEYSGYKANIFSTQKRFGLNQTTSSDYYEANFGAESEDYIFKISSNNKGTYVFKSDGIYLNGVKITN